jgi:hypothetical protein
MSPAFYLKNYANQQRPRVLENEVLRKVFKPKREKETERERNKHEREVSVFRESS